MGLSSDAAEYFGPLAFPLLGHRGGHSLGLYANGELVYDHEVRAPSYSHTAQPMGHTPTERKQTHTKKKYAQHILPLCKVVVPTVQHPLRRAFPPQVIATLTGPPRKDASPCKDEDGAAIGHGASVLDGDPDDGDEDAAPRCCNDHPWMKREVPYRGGYESLLF